MFQPIFISIDGSATCVIALQEVFKFAASVAEGVVRTTATSGLLARIEWPR